MALHKLNGFVIDKHFNQPCPGNSSAASVLILSFYSIVRQPSPTLLGQNVSAGALKVKHCAIKGIVMRITTYGAGALLHCSAGKHKGTSLADLGKGAGLPLTLYA